MSFITPQFSRYVRNFAGGYLDAPEPDTLPLGATPDARNAFLQHVMEARDGKEQGPRATLSKRKAAQLLNPAPMVAGHTIDLLFWYEPEDGPAQLLAVCNAALYRYNGIDAWVLIGVLTGFVPGALVQAIGFKDNVWMTDGTAMRRYNGTALLPVGLPTPATPPGLTTTAGGSLPVGATYESVTTWYDSVMGHESSPSGIAAAVTTNVGNRTRHHSRPPNPPSNATDWKVYVRRVDTNELNFFLAATVPIGTSVVDDDVSDAARRTPAPKPSSNDAPPVFAAMVVFKDYGIGIESDQSYYSTSKQNDLESWHPADRFALERGSGKPLRSAIVYSADCLLHKPTKTWRLTGDRPPFKAEPVHSNYGNVGPRSAIEIERTLYAWDERKGPYRTDLVEWDPLATNRIAAVIANINREQLQHIQVAHDPENTLIVWAVAATTRSQTRRRHLLAYNYRLNVWLPPVTGLEYSTLVSYQPTGGVTGLYAGDYWGRVYKLFAADREGIPAGADVIATVTSATTSSVTCADAHFYTGGSGMAGLLVLAQSPSGGFQWRRIASNTATVIQLDVVNGSPWATVPSAAVGELPAWTIHLGAIEFYWMTPRIDLGRPDLLKRGGYLFVEGRSAAGGDVLDVRASFNQQLSGSHLYDFDFETAGSVWGVDLWGVGVWGAQQRLVKKRRINRAFYSMQVRFESYFADQPIDITAYGVEADGRPRRRSA